MIQEKSCGAVVYKEVNDSYLFLLEKMQLGHISIPKGHVEDNETEEETALREIKEETNLEVELDTGFRHVISYSPYEGCMKDVVFFIAEVKDDTKQFPQEAEVSSLMWKTYEEAMALLTHASDQETLSDACQYLQSKKQNH